MNNSPRLLQTETQQTPLINDGDVIWNVFFVKRPGLPQWQNLNPCSVSFPQDCAFPILRARSASCFLSRGILFYFFFFKMSKNNKIKRTHSYASILLIESGCPLSSQNTVSVISPDCLACVFHKWSLSLFLQWTCPSLERRHSSSISTHFVCDSLIHGIPVKVTPMCCKLKLSALLLRGTLYPWRLLLLSFPLATELSYGPRQKTTHDTILWSLWWYRFLLLLACSPGLLV